MKVKFSKEDLEKIERAVTKAEKMTSGEIVPMIVGQSHDYWWVNWAWTSIGFMGGTVAALLDSQINYGHLTLVQALGFQFAGAAITGTLSCISGVRRFIIPRRWMAYQVHRQCLASFIAAGLTETRERTGILLYLSLFEKRVEILADKGIADKLPQNYWEDQVKTIVTGIHEGKTILAIETAIHEMGNKLSKYFPIQADDKNELHNHPILDPKTRK